MNTRILKVLSVLTLVGLTSNPATAQIYKIVKPDGSVGYTDVAPVEGTAEAQLPDIIIQPSTPVPSAATTRAPARAAVVRKNLRITAPEDETVLRGPNNQLTINLSVSPALEEGESVQLLQNGSPAGAPQSSNSWNLSRLLPGAHKFSVQLLDKTGQPNGMSETLTVYVIL